MTTIAEIKKTPPAQANVRIVGGKIQVELRAYGRDTLTRTGELFKELTANASGRKDIADAVVKAATALDELGRLLGCPVLGTQPAAGGAAT